MHVPALIQYLRGLSENNNRAWFVMNKPSYDILREEFTVLVGAVIAGIARYDAPIAAADPKKSQFRINRDVRFAKDKSPYKTTFSAAISASAAGRKGRGPMYYFHIDADGNMLLAGGCYMPEPDVLLAIRTFIAAQPRRFEKLLRNKGFVETWGGLADEERLVRPPKGFSADTPHIDAIRLKSFVSARTIAVSDLPPDDLAATIVGQFKSLHPLVMWLREALVDVAQGV